MAGWDDAELVRRLRARDEEAFAWMLQAWTPGMLRLAPSFLSTRESAEEVLQDTWVAVLTAVDSFEGRSSLRTWVYRIFVNTAKRRGQRESRTVPWSSWALDPEDAEAPTVDPSRFQDSTEPFPGHWRSFPAAWPSPESAVLGSEVRERVMAAVDGLPPRQRIVLVLRDVEGYDADEVCAILDITAANQRVLLHRARAVVRGTLEEYFASAGDAFRSTERQVR